MMINRIFKAMSNGAHNHPNLFAFSLVILVFIWAVIRIGDESDRRIQESKASEARIEARFNLEAQARQEIICLVLTDGVDRDRILIDSLIEASKQTPSSPPLTEAQEKQRAEATKIFFAGLGPTLKPINCLRFKKDPVRYLSDLRKRPYSDSRAIRPSTTTTVKVSQ